MFLRRYRDQQARHDRGDQHLIDGVSLRGDVAQAFRMCSIAVRIESDISEVHGAPFGNRSQEPVAAHHLDLHVVDIPGTGATFFTDGNAQIHGRFARCFKNFASKFNV